VPPETANVSIDDTILVQQFRQGDSVAMERLILKYQNRIHNIIIKICANRDDAAELTQETFVKVIENIERFQGRSSFYTWVFRIAVNLTLNYCKKRVKIAFKSLDAEVDEQDGPVKRQLKDFLNDESSPEPAEIAQNRELCELAKKSLLRLDDDQRAVVILRDIEGMSYAQIAEVLEIELGTVRSRLSRARGNLREILESLIK